MTSSTARPWQHQPVRRAGLARPAERARPRRHLGQRLLVAAGVVGVAQAGWSWAAWEGSEAGALIGAGAVTTLVVAVGWARLLAGHREDLACVLGVGWVVLAIASPALAPGAWLAGGACGLAAMHVPFGLASHRAG